MADIATLQLRVDSKQADAAADDLDELARSAKGADNAVDGVAGAAKRAKAPLKAVGNSAIVTGKKMSVMRGRMQQVGFQVQDMAVQIQGGTSAFVAFGQQGSQLAGAFGPSGAIIGAFIALGSIAGGFLFNSLMKASKAMETLDDDIGELTKGFHDLTSAQKAYLLSSSQARTLGITDSLTALNDELKDAEIGLRKLESGQRETAGRRVIRFTASPEELKKARDGITKIAAARDVALAKLEREVKLRGDVNAGIDKQAEKESRVADKRVVRRFEQVSATIAQSGESPAEAAMRQFEEREVAIQNFRDLSAANDASAKAADLANTAVFEAEKTAIIKNELEQRQKLEQATQQAQIGAAGQIAGNLAAIAKEGGKEQFDNYKAFASAQAVINAGLAISGVLAQSAILGPLAIPLSVTIGALAAVQVAQIQSQEFQPRALGGQMKAGGSFLVGERGPELVTMGNKNANIQAAGSFGGAQPIQVTNVYQISTGVAATVSAEIQRLAPQLTQLSVQAMNQAMRKGGATSKLVGRR